ncbi:MAG TPA: response regulator [Planctomycetota bacterium]|nr:response regulator [Planctomycetota bacterium]
MTEDVRPRAGSILVVDDDEFVCNSLKWLLLDEGYEVEVSPDGKTALQMLTRRDFDLVLTDLMMPDVDGLAVLKQVKRASPATAVIILTGYGTLEAAMSALKDGAYDFLTKPCDDGEMKYKIKGALEQKRLRSRVAALEGAEAKLRAAAQSLDAELTRMTTLDGEELKTALAALKRKFDELRETLGPIDTSTGGNA